MAAAISLVVTGLPGSGKSFLCNVLTHAHTFVHAASARSVTQDATFHDVKCVDRLLRVWNLQGMCEPDAMHADEHRASLTTAFSSTPLQIAVYVLHHRSGRLQADDVAYFKELVRVYGLRPQSTVVVCNTWPSGCAGASEWFAELKVLFQRATAFPVEHMVLTARQTVTAFDSPEADANAAALYRPLRIAVPYAHQKRGEIRLDAECLRNARQLVSAEHDRIQTQRHAHEAVIVRVNHDITSVRAGDEANANRFRSHMDRFAAQTKQLSAADAFAQSIHEQMLVRMRAQMDAIAEQKRQNDLIHAQNMNTLCSQTDGILQWIREVEQKSEFARAEYRSQRKKSRNVFRQLETMGKTMLRKPLTALPIVATVVLAPEAAPAVSASLGVSATTAGAIVGAGIQATSAIIQRQDVLKCAMAGAITGGAGALAAPLSVPSAAAVQACAAGAAAIVTQQNPLAAMVTSVVASTVAAGLDNSSTGYAAGDAAATSGFVQGVQSVATKMAIGAVAGAAGALVVDRHAIAAGVASGVITALVTGTALETKRVLQSPAPPPPPPQALQSEIRREPRVIRDVGIVDNTSDAPVRNLRSILEELYPRSGGGGGVCRRSVLVDSSISRLLVGSSSYSSSVWNLCVDATVDSSLDSHGTVHSNVHEDHDLSKVGLSRGGRMHRVSAGHGLVIQGNHHGTVVTGMMVPLTADHTLSTMTSHGPSQEYYPNGYRTSNTVIKLVPLSTSASNGDSVHANTNNGSDVLLTQEVTHGPVVRSSNYCWTDTVTSEIESGVLVQSHSGHLQPFKVLETTYSRDYNVNGCVRDPLIYSAVGMATWFGTPIAGVSVRALLYSSSAALSGVIATAIASTAAP